MSAVKPVFPRGPSSRNEIANATIVCSYHIQTMPDSRDKRQSAYGLRLSKEKRLGGWPCGLRARTSLRLGFVHSVLT